MDERTVILLLTAVVFVLGLLLGYGVRAQNARNDQARYWKAIDEYPIKATMSPGPQGSP